MMKAWLSYAPGGPDTLRFDDIADPRPGPGQVLIRSEAVSLNYPDALMIEDRYQYRPTRPFAPGSEVAGVVSAVDPDVTNVAPGDRVLAVTGANALAELTLAEAWKTFVLPDGMPYDVASSLHLVYGTNIHGLVDRANLKAGQTMLVLGAAGGVGLSAVQLGKAFGARVVGAVSSEDKAALARQAGADDVVLYSRSPLSPSVAKELTGRLKAACPEGYDVIYDPIGGDYGEPALRAIGWEGRYAVVGFAAGISNIPLNLALLKGCSIVGVFWGAWADRNREQFRRHVDTLFGLWREGKINPLISERLPFAAAPDALARMGNRSIAGKVVISIGER